MLVFSARISLTMNLEEDGNRTAILQRVIEAQNITYFALKAYEVSRDSIDTTKEIMFQT